MERRRSWDGLQEIGRGFFFTSFFFFGKRAKRLYRKLGVKPLTRKHKLTIIGQPTYPRRDMRLGIFFLFFYFFLRSQRRLWSHHYRALVLQVSSIITRFPLLWPGARLKNKKSKWYVISLLITSVPWSRGWQSHQADSYKVVDIHFLIALWIPPIRHPPKKVKENKTRRLVGWLAWFSYGISTLEGYLMLNHVYIWVFFQLHYIRSVHASWKAYIIIAIHRELP